MCPNSSNGQHNFQLRTINAPGGTVVIRVCLLCQQEG